jgi:hypothetical protein
VCDPAGDRVGAGSSCIAEDATSVGVTDNLKLSRTLAKCDRSGSRVSKRACVLRGSRPGARTPEVL